MTLRPPRPAPRRALRRPWAGALLLPLALPLGAQDLRSVDPGAVQQRQEDLQELRRLERDLGRDAAPAEPVIEAPEGPGEQRPADGARTLVVQEIRVGDSEVLSPEEIRGIVGPLEGRRVTIAELFGAVNALNELYGERGCVTCRAFLPPQDVAGGVVRLQLVEGRLGALRVEGAEHTRPGFVERRIRLPEGELFDLGQLERELLRLNATTDLATRARLEPGEAFGMVDAVVQVREPPRWEGAIFADNAGRDTIGEYRLGATAINASLTGRADPLTLSVYGAEGTRALSGSYSTPLGTRGTRATLFADYSEIEIVDGPFEVLDITGEAWSAALELSHPLRITPELRVQGFASYGAKSSETDFGTATITDIDVRTAGLGIDARHARPGRVLATRHFVSVGLDDGGGDHSFFKYNGAVTGTLLFADGGAALLRALWQWSDLRNLPPAEQFQLGGTATVRGYEEGLLIGDRGWLASAEYQFPAVAGADVAGAPVRGLLFADAGAAFPDRPGGADADDYLYSVGLGVLASLPGGVSLRALAGFPLTAPEGESQSPRLHLYVQRGF